MNGYLAKRLVGALPTLVGVSLLTFLFIRLIPGDAIAARLGTSTALTPEQLVSLRAYFGLDQPLPQQYWSWLTALFRGDAGYSIRRARKNWRSVVLWIFSRLIQPYLSQSSVSNWELTELRTLSGKRSPNQQTTKAEQSAPG